MSIHQSESASFKNPYKWKHNFPIRHPVSERNPYEMHAKQTEPPDQIKMHPCYKDL